MTPRRTGPIRRSLSRPGWSGVYRALVSLIRLQNGILPEFDLQGVEEPKECLRAMFPDHEIDEGASERIDRPEIPVIPGWSPKVSQPNRGCFGSQRQRIPGELG
jgi:hypothetical protein